MADYIAAQITIGGQIPAPIVPALCQAIIQEHLSLEWGDADFTPGTVQDLLAARCTVDGAEVLRLYDDNAAWGEFPELEAFLTQHDISFDRFHEGKFETDPSLRQFRPGAGLTDFRATSTGQVVVPVQGLLPLRDDLATASQLLASGQHEPAAGKLQVMLAALAEHLITPVALSSMEIAAAVQV